MNMFVGTMKPPKPFKIDPRKDGYSLCMGCDKWKMNNRFRHEGIYWILCAWDYADYWENTDKLSSDYKWFG